MFKRVIKRFSGKQTGRDVPIYLSCYHKVGSVLLAKVFGAICAEFGWTFRPILGKCDQVPQDADVVLFMHSLVDLNRVSRPYLGAHFIRDPRDVIVSGYLYHQRTAEAWCTNTNFDTSKPIMFPQVPYSQEHRSHRWKAAYLRSLNERSYQQNLLDKPQSEGLLFEMANYGTWTVKAMLDWDYGNHRLLELRFEELMSKYDETFSRLFVHLGFEGQVLVRALQLATRHDLQRMTRAQVRQDPHISSRETRRWRSYFSEAHKNAFRSRFGEALVRLGYEQSHDW